MKRGRSFFVTALFAVLFITSCSRAEYTYDIIDLGKYCVAQSINDNGQVVGSMLTYSNHAVLFDTTGKGNHIILDSDSMEASIAECINNKGQIVGYEMVGMVLVVTVFDSTGNGDNLHIEGTWAGGEAYEINNLGHIVGYVNNNEGRFAALFNAMDPLESVLLGALTIPGSVALSINDKDRVVGLSAITEHRGHAAWFDSSGGGDN